MLGSQDKFIKTMFLSKENVTGDLHEVATA